MNATCTCAMTGPEKCPRPEHRGYTSTDTWRWAHGVGPLPRTWQPHNPSDDKAGDQS
jgi:hypothetical protein